MQDKQVKGKAIAAFLAAKSFAVVGVSADRHKIGNALFRAMREQGLSVLPVHKSLDQVEESKSYRSVAELRAKVEAVVTAVPPEETEHVVQQCAEAGIGKIWMQQGSSSNRALALAHEKGLEVITGECLLMFLEPVRSIHRFHRGIKKITGRYPAPVSS
jgi:predicted CoA-binding protein